MTDRGRPTHVLLSFEAYRALTGRRESIVDLLAAPVDGPAPPARDRLDR